MFDHNGGLWVGNKNQSKNPLVRYPTLHLKVQRDNKKQVPTTAMYLRIHIYELYHNTWEILGQNFIIFSHLHTGKQTELKSYLIYVARSWLSTLPSVKILTVILAKPQKPFTNTTLYTCEDWQTAAMAIKVTNTTLPFPPSTYVNFTRLFALPNVYKWRQRLKVSERDCAV